MISFINAVFATPLPKTKAQNPKDNVVCSVKLVEMYNFESPQNWLEGVLVVSPDFWWTPIGGDYDPFRSNMDRATFGLSREGVVISPLLEMVPQNFMVDVEVV